MFRSNLKYNRCRSDESSAGHVSHSSPKEHPMNARQAIRINIESANQIALGYLSDLSDAELLVRPVPGANHTAWQLGHILSSQRDMVETTCPGSMPALPAGFADKYTNETAKLDSVEAFHPKATYMNVQEQLHAATLKALDKLSNSDFNKPAPEKFRNFVKTVGELFSIQGTHLLMHAGQWAVTRRKLGRKPLY